ncbi:outer dense fiber protein 1 [Sphaerodactylus townsendi]|uniref:outer dense fiber protein 1 n=1 Tax=Sphaerodactylus townsendi TaxID=933632 RepID=UPI0020260A55|nr:outer dense fiber protein 1 [Sphaerodactylus townsendi]
MASLCQALETVRRDLRRTDREIKRRLRLMDMHCCHSLCNRHMHLHCLCDISLHPHCCCSLHPYPHCLCSMLCCSPCRIPCLTVLERRAIRAKIEAEQELARLRRRVAKMLASSTKPKLLALMDIKGFDPEDIKVKVQDGKVKVSAEHEEEFKTCQGKEYNYSTVTKEICLPPGVNDEDITYSIGPTSLVRIESPGSCPPCLLSLL